MPGQALGRPSPPSFAAVAAAPCTAGNLEDNSDNNNSSSKTQAAK
jgi:hypothetical protein